MLRNVHDVVIVGAGSAGCVLAARLTEDPDTSVLLIEAGPGDRKLHVRVPAAFSKLFRSPLDWGYDTVPQTALDGRRLVFPRGKVVGGSASINAMMAIRGHRADHDAWPRGWGWEDVASAYERSDLHFPRAGQRRPSPLTFDFLASAAAAGIPPASDLNGADNEGAGLTPVSIRRGRRYSVVDGYLRPALRRPNLTLLTRARTTRVLVDGGRARGVAYRLDDTHDEEEAHAAREVVLAAGAIDTPKLLLLSGIGPREELERHAIAVVHASPAVGRNLRDHLANGILAAVDAETLYSAERPRHVVAWLTLRRGPLTSNVAEAAAFVRVDPAARAPDVELIFAPVLFEEEGLVPPSQDGVTVAAVLLQPQSVGEVRLASADPLAPPEIDPRYLSDPDGHDERTLMEGYGLPVGSSAPPLSRSRHRRAAPRRRSRRRRGPRSPSPRAVADALSPRRHLPDGRGRRRGRDPGSPPPRDRRPARRRRFRHPGAPAWSHELADRDGRRARRGADADDVTDPGAVLCCPDKFRGTMTAREAAGALAAGVERAGRAAMLLPLADGGEGTLDVLCPEPTDRRRTRVTGPLGEPVDAEWGLRGDTAVVEMARASGLALVAGRNDPLQATTFGTGQLLRAALDAGVRRAIVAVGGSATVDGGLGALEALDFDLRGADVVVACDVSTGFIDAARVYGPQKGADDDAVAELERRLDELAGRYRDERGVDVRAVPGAGAAGGLAGGLAALGARLVPGAALVADTVGLCEAVASASLVLTGEGRVDATSFAGKVVGHVLAEARRLGAPAGVVTGDADRDAVPDDVPCLTLVQLAGSVDVALADAERLTADAAEALARRL